MTLFVFVNGADDVVTFGDRLCGGRRCPYIWNDSGLGWRCGHPDAVGASVFPKRARCVVITRREIEELDRVFLEHNPEVDK